MKIEIISLDAKTTSNLDWSKEKDKALSAIAKGKRILWYLDLGLFRQLNMPLSSAPQFLNLGLAIEHFKNSVWPEFRELTEGVALYQGSSDYQDFVWDEEQKRNFPLWCKEREIDGAEAEVLFKRDVASDFLNQLAEKLPNEIPLHLIFSELPEALLLKALLTNPVILGRFSPYFLKESFLWQCEKEHSFGICMPSADVLNPSLLAPFRALLEKMRKAEFKLIPEEMLTVCWEGLDTLLYSKEAMSSQGKRKLGGFLAAGGKAIPIEEIS